MSVQICTSVRFSCCRSSLRGQVLSRYLKCELLNAGEYQNFALSIDLLLYLLIFGLFYQLYSADLFSILILVFCDNIHRPFDQFLFFSAVLIIIIFLSFYSILFFDNYFFQEGDSFCVLDPRSRPGEKESQDLKSQK